MWPGCPHGAPRRRPFPAVRSAASTAQIGRGAVILRKTPYVFGKSTRAPEALSEYFANNTSDNFQINPQSRTDELRIFCKKTLPFIKNQPALQRHSQRFFRKPPQIFLKAKYRPPLIISFFPKKCVWPVARAHGRARRTSLL